MISIILDFLMAVFLARLVLWVAQLFLTSGRSDDGHASSPAPGGHTARRGPPIDRSSAIDVPFTEIPPEDGQRARDASDVHDDPPTSAETEAHDDTPARSAAGNR